MQYLRYDRVFVILATHGKQHFFQDEPFHDIREDPITFHGYSIGCGKGVDGSRPLSVPGPLSVPLPFRSPLPFPAGKALPTLFRSSQ